MKKPVVVYAASGYTGRLTCESLTKLGVPFTAAGRNQGRLDAVVAEMRAKGADCDAVACAHTPEGLRELLRGTRVVINISGPFSLLGREVVQAALDEGVHYVDSTGEQDFMFDIRRDFGPLFEQKQLVLAPSSAFLWGIGAAAAEVCLETAGIDSIEVVYSPPSLQTVASLQSMFRTVRRRNENLVDGSRQPFDATRAHRVEVPGRGKVGALCVGAGEATFLCGDARVRNCRTFFASDALVRASRVFKLWGAVTNGLLIRFIAEEKLDAFSDAAILKLKKDPPAEDLDTNLFVVSVVGTGGGKTVRAELHGTSPYVFTGFMGAMTAQELLQGNAKRFGYVSAAQTLGPRHVLERIEEIGTRASFEVSGAGVTHAVGGASQSAHA